MTGKERRNAEKAKAQGLKAVPTPKLRTLKEIEAKLNERIEFRNKLIEAIGNEQKQIEAMQASVQKNISAKLQTDGVIDALVFTLQGTGDEPKQEPKSTE